MALRTAALLSVASAAAGMKCPGSAAFVHASSRVVLQAAASCKDVGDEMVARIQGQYGAWHDPHNNGTYAILSATSSELDLSRKSGNGKFTDKLTFTFADAAGGGCEVSGCSESQVTSVLDFSTNYCNLRMLYCRSSDGCRPVVHDFEYTEASVTGSAGAGRDPNACLKVLGEAELAAEAWGPEDTRAALACIAKKCPLDPQSLEPSKACILSKCGGQVAKCMLHTDCRRAVKCEQMCSSPLVGTEDAPLYLAVVSCVNSNCPDQSADCVQEKCGAVVQACQDSARCERAGQCSRDCLPATGEVWLQV